LILLLLGVLLVLALLALLKRGSEGTSPEPVRFPATRVG
jgi:hypothetical protein